jgi:hypothetical protein
MTPAPKRRWFAYSLRTLFVVVTVVSICVAWVAYERRQSRHEFQIVEQLQARNGTVHIEVAGLFDAAEPYGKPNRKRSWWRWALSGLCGPRVRSLQLAGNPLFDDLSPLAGLKSLQSLDVQENQVSDLTVLAQLKSLNYLHLKGTQVNDLVPLAGLKNLAAVALDDTQITDLSPLAGRENLEEVWLQDTQVSDLAPLAKLKKLRILSVEATPVCDVSVLAGLKNLQLIILDRTPVSEERVEILQRALPNCHIADDYQRRSQTPFPTPH